MALGTGDRPKLSRLKVGLLSRDMKYSLLLGYGSDMRKLQGSRSHYSSSPRKRKRQPIMLYSLFVLEKGIYYIQEIDTGPGP